MQQLRGGCLVAGLCFFLLNKIDPSLRAQYNSYGLTLDRIPKRPQNVSLPVFDKSLHPVQNKGIFQGLKKSVLSVFSCRCSSSTPSYRAHIDSNSFLRCTRIPSVQQWTCGLEQQECTNPHLPFPHCQFISTGMTQELQPP